MTYLQQQVLKSAPQHADEMALLTEIVRRIGTHDPVGAMYLCMARLRTLEAISKASLVDYTPEAEKGQ